jgi:hypothetical protein
MLLRACIGGLLLAPAACAQLPERVRIDVDGRTVEVRQQGVPQRFGQGQWSGSRRCEPREPRIKREEIRGTIVSVGPEVLEDSVAEGEVRKMYRCSR